MTTDILSNLLLRVRQFVDEEVIPLEKLLISRPWAEVEPLFDQKREVVKEIGLWGLALPVEYGGQGLTLAEFGRVSEVLGARPAAITSLAARRPTWATWSYSSTPGPKRNGSDTWCPSRAAKSDPVLP